MKLNMLSSRGSSKQGVISFLTNSLIVIVLFTVIYFFKYGPSWLQQVGVWLIVGAGILFVGLCLILIIGASWKEARKKTLEENPNAIYFHVVLKFIWFFIIAAAFLFGFLRSLVIQGDLRIAPITGLICMAPFLTISWVYKKLKSPISPKNVSNELDQKNSETDSGHIRKS